MVVAAILWLTGRQDLFFFSFPTKLEDECLNLWLNSHHLAHGPLTVLILNTVESHKFNWTNPDICFVSKQGVFQMDTPFILQRTLSVKVDSISIVLNCKGHIRVCGEVMSWSGTLRWSC